MDDSSNITTQEAGGAMRKPLGIHMMRSRESAQVGVRGMLSNQWPLASLRTWASHSNTQSQGSPDIAAPQPVPGFLQVLNSTW